MFKAFLDLASDMVEIGLGGVEMVADFIEPVVEDTVEAGEDVIEMLKEMIE